MLGILSHEFATVRTAMFTDSGDLRASKAKSVLNKLLQKEDSNRNMSKQIICLIIDRSAILYIVHWPVNGTVSDYTNNFKSYIKKILPDGDAYFILTDMYRLVRKVTQDPTGKKASILYQLTVGMHLPTQNVV